MKNRKVMTAKLRQKAKSSLITAKADFRAFSSEVDDEVGLLCIERAFQSLFFVTKISALVYCK